MRNHACSSPHELSSAHDQTQKTGCAKQGGGRNRDDVAFQNEGHVVGRPGAVEILPVGAEGVGGEGPAVVAGLVGEDGAGGSRCCGGRTDKKKRPIRVRRRITDSPVLRGCTLQGQRGPISDVPRCCGLSWIIPMPDSIGFPPDTGGRSGRGRLATPNRFSDVPEQPRFTESSPRVNGTGRPRSESRDEIGFQKRREADRP